jgi:hypothetical protein
MRWDLHRLRNRGNLPRRRRRGLLHAPVHRQAMRYPEWVRREMRLRGRHLPGGRRLLHAQLYRSDLRRQQRLRRPLQRALRQQRDLPERQLRPQQLLAALRLRSDLRQRPLRAALHAEWLLPVRMLVVLQLQPGLRRPDRHLHRSAVSFSQGATRIRTGE